jgi:hypothetical protein
MVSCGQKGQGLLSTILPIRWLQGVPVRRLSSLALIVLGGLVVAGCTDAASGPHVAGPSAMASGDSVLAIEPGHCWIEPLTVDGQVWAVDKEDQFGWGGGTPKSWVGKGRVLRLNGEHLIYVDNGGTRLDLWPVHDKRARNSTGRWCD